jgi:hypothetical protein
MKNDTENSPRKAVFIDKPRGHSIDSLIRDTLRQLLHIPTKSRQNVADELSQRLGRKISVHILHKWVSDGKQVWRLPADVVPALCEILGDDTLQRLLLNAPMKEALELGEWVAGSRWILEKVNVSVGRSANRGLQKAKHSRRAQRQ